MGIHAPDYVLDEVQGWSMPADPEHLLDPDAVRVVAVELAREMFGCRILETDCSSSTRRSTWRLPIVLPRLAMMTGEMRERSS